MPTTQMRDSKAAQRRAALGNTEIDVIVDALEEKDVKSILLADGWHNIPEGGVEQVAFAVGRAHSPLSPNKTWTSFRYINDQNMLCYTPVESVLSI